MKGIDTWHDCTWKLSKVLKEETIFNLFFDNQFHNYETEIFSEDASPTKSAPIIVELLNFPLQNCLLGPLKCLYANITQQHGPLTSNDFNLSLNEYNDKSVTVEFMVIVVLDPLR